MSTHDNFLRGTSKTVVITFVCPVSDCEETKGFVDHPQKELPCWGTKANPHEKALMSPARR